MNDCRIYNLLFVFVGTAPNIKIPKFKTSNIKILKVYRYIE